MEEEPKADEHERQRESPTSQKENLRADDYKDSVMQDIYNDISSSDSDDDDESITKIDSNKLSNAS